MNSSGTSAPVFGDIAARPSRLGETGLAVQATGLRATLWRLLWFMLLPRDSFHTLPTRAGFVMMIVSIGIGMAAYNNANNVLFMALALLLSTLVLSGVLSWLNFRGVRWRLVLPVHWRAGEPATVRVELANEKKVLPTYSLLFNARTRRLDSAKAQYLPDRLEPSGNASLEWIFSPQARGLEVVEVSAVESQFPFGFLRKKIGGGLRQQVWVWPARVPYEFKPPKSRAARQPGEIQGRTGAGSDLVGLRPYRAGDPPRLVHWKATARLRNLVVRQTVEEEQTGYHLVVDAAKSRWKEPEQFERLCSFVASLAEDLFVAGRLRAVTLQGAPTHAIKRQADLHAVLDELARLEPAEHSKAVISAGADVVSFHPVSRQQVHAYLGDQITGTA